MPAAESLEYTRCRPDASAENHLQLGIRVKTERSVEAASSGLGCGNLAGLGRAGWGGKRGRKRTVSCCCRGTPGVLEARVDEVK